MLEEVRTPEPPIRLSAVFYEPGDAEQVAAELGALGDVVVAMGAPITAPLEGQPARDCDALLHRRGVGPLPPAAQMVKLVHALSGMSAFAPAEEGVVEGAVPEGSYEAFPVFETNADGVFCALQGRRLPARRHPLGIQRRIAELEDDHVVDDGGELWHRRIEELEAAAAALCAHRYAVGHACWLGNPAGGRRGAAGLRAAGGVLERRRAAAGRADSAPTRLDFSQWSTTARASATREPASAPS